MEHDLRKAISRMRRDETAEIIEDALNIILQEALGPGKILRVETRGEKECKYSLEIFNINMRQFLIRHATSAHIDYCSCAGIFMKCPCKNPEGVPAIHEGQALQECQGRLEGLNGALKEIIYFLIDEMAGLRVIDDPEAYSEAIEGVKSTVKEVL